MTTVKPYAADDVAAIDLQVTGKQGWGANAPGFGILNTNKYTPMISPDFPENMWFYDIDKALEKPLATGEKTLSPRRLPVRLPEI